MKKTNLIFIMALLTSSFGYVRASENTSETMGLSTKALLSKEMQKNINWTGLVVQTSINTTSTCFQIVETVPFKGKKPKYDVLEDDSRFIACVTGQLAAKDYDGRLLTVKGDIESFYTDDDKNSEFPIVKIFGLKIWNPKTLRRYTNLSYSSTHNVADVGGMTHLQVGGAISTVR